MSKGKNCKGLSSAKCFTHSPMTPAINTSNLESRMLGDTSEITQLSACNRQTFTQSDIGEVSNYMCNI